MNEMNFENVNLQEHFGTIITNEINPLKTMIIPEYQNFYEWDFKDSLKEIEIFFNINNEKILNNTNIILHENKTAISIKCDDLIPFLEGTLFRKIESFEINKLEEKLIIKLIKSEELYWTFPINYFYPNTKNIDPKSSYLLSNSPTHLSFDKNFCFENLRISAYLGYIPSLCKLGTFAISTNTMVQYGFSLFVTAIEYYNSSRAMAEMAENLLKFPNYYGLSFKLFERSLKNGFEYSKLSLGRLLSPLSSFGNVPKDPFLSITYLEEFPNNPTALHELAMLYLNGIGVKKDKIKAKNLQEKAKKLQKNIPNLYDLSLTKYYKILTLIIIILFCLIIFKFLKKKKTN